MHFIGAVLWLALGGVGLTTVAPDLAAARFLAPRVLAVTHVYTVGAIVASVFGALYQGSLLIAGQYVRLFFGRHRTG